MKMCKHHNQHSVLNTKLSWMGSLTRWTYTLYTWRWKLRPLLSHIQRIRQRIELNRITTPQSQTLALFFAVFSFHCLFWVLPWCPQRFHRRDQVLPVIETHLLLPPKKCPNFFLENPSPDAAEWLARWTQDGHGWFGCLMLPLLEFEPKYFLSAQCDLMIWWHQRQPRHSAKPPPKPHAKAVCCF